MPAVIASSTPESVYQYAGQNLAPKSGLELLSQNRPNYTPNELQKELKLRYDRYKKQDYEAYTEFCDTGRMIANLRMGKLLLMRSVRDGRYIFAPKDGKFQDNKTVGGLFQFYSTKLTAEWLSSKPERDPICPSDDDRIEEFISAVKIVQDHYDIKFFDSKYEELESLSAQDYGTWITRFRYDPDVKDIVCELLDFPACRWDIRFRAEESPYFIYESKCATSKLEHLLKAEIAPDGEDSTDYGLQLRDAIARQGSNVMGAGKSNPYGTYSDSPDENIVTEMWLQPEAYLDIDLSKNEPTFAGIDLPKGQNLLEMFPTGMCVVGINGMQTIIHLYAENHREHIVSGLYHVQSFSGVGKGISDTVDGMKELNDLHSQLLAHTKAHTMPGFGFNSNMVTEDQAKSIGKPRKNIALDFSQAPDGVNNVNQVISAILPGNAANGAYQMVETLKNNLQMSFQVTDFSNGLPGVDNKTATGAKIGDANAEMVLVPQHLNKADHRKRADAVIYNLFKRYCDKPKFFATNAKNGITKGKYISGSEFDGIDIEFEVVANSEVPNTPYQQRDAISQILQFTGGVGGLIEAAQMNPDITGEIVTAFGGKLSIPNKTDIARICRRRIEQAKKLLNGELEMQKIMQSVMGEPPDNTNLAAAIVSQIQPPISPQELYSSQKAQWMADLLDSDEMQYESVEFRYVLEELIARQLQVATFGAAQLEQDQNIGMILSNLPSVIGEQAMSQQNQQLTQSFEQEQMAQQQQQAAMENQQALATEQQKADIQETQADAQDKRQSAQSDKSHKQALQLKSLEHLSKMEQSKNQAKAKGK